MAIAKKPLPLVRENGWSNSGCSLVSRFKPSLSLVFRALSAGLPIAFMGIASPAQAESRELWHQLPEYTALTLLIETSETAWQPLDQFQMFRLLENTFGFRPNPVSLPLLPYGLDFQTQVQPWIGDTAVLALLPADPGEGAAMADYLVMMAPIADPTAFAEQEATLMTLRDGEPEVETFAGTDIYVWPAPEPVEDPIPHVTDGEAEAESPSLDNPTPDPIQNFLRPPQSQPFAPTLSFSDPIGLPLTLTPKAEEPLNESIDSLEVDVPLPIPSLAYRGLALAVLPDALVVAENSAAIKQLLTYRQEYSGDGHNLAEALRPERRSLAESREFQRTLANRADTQALITVYGNALELLNYELPTESLPTGEWPMPSPSSDLVQSLQAINFGGTLEGLIYPTVQGLQVRGRYYYDAVPYTFGLTPARPEADSLLSLLPASTFLVASGYDLADFWQGLATGLEVASEFTRNGLNFIRTRFTAATGLDLDRDVLNWMDGEFAITAIPATETPLVYVGLGMLVETSDRPTAETTLAALDQVIANLGNTVAIRTINQQSATSWEYAFPLDDEALFPYLSFFSHGWPRENTLALMSGVGPMESIIAPSPHDPLADYFLFQQATASFPQPNNGYFYVNVGATLSLIYRAFGIHGPGLGESYFFEQVKPILGSIRTLSATTAQTPRYIEINGLLGLAPYRN